MANITSRKVVFQQNTVEGISVIIPCKDEEDGIEATIAEIKKYMDPIGIDYEIIVVDDGSRDQSQSRALASGATVLVHRKNLGYGNAIMNGIDIANFPVVAITDADGTYPASVLPEMIEQANQYDMVIGQRVWNDYNTSRFSLVLRKGLAKVVRLLGGVKSPDFNSGLRIFHREIIPRYRHMLCPTFSFTTTLTMLFALTHKSISYVSIPYSVRIGKTKVSKLKDTIKTFIYVFVIANQLQAYRPSLLVILFGLLTNLIVLLVCKLVDVSLATQIVWHLLFSLLTITIQLAMLIMPITKILTSIVEKNDCTR